MLAEAALCILAAGPLLAGLDRLTNRGTLALKRGASLKARAERHRVLSVEVIHLWAERGTAIDLLRMQGMTARRAAAVYEERLLAAEALRNGRAGSGRIEGDLDDAITF